MILDILKGELFGNYLAGGIDNDGLCRLSKRLSDRLSSANVNERDPRAGHKRPSGWNQSIAAR